MYKATKGVNRFLFFLLRASVPLCSKIKQEAKRIEILKNKNTDYNKPCFKKIIKNLNYV